MTDDKQKLAPIPPIKLSELFAEHDRLGDAVKWGWFRPRDPRDQELYKGLGVPAGSKKKAEE